VPDAREEVIAHVRAQERHILGRLDLVAHDRDVDPVVTGVVGVLPVDGHAFPCRLDHQEHNVEPREQTAGERVRPCGHVHDDVLPGPVDEVVEVQLDRSGLAVIAGHPEVILVELPRGHERHAPDAP